MTEGRLGGRARGRCSPVTPRRGPPAARSGYVHPAGLRTGRSRDAATVQKEKKKRKKKDTLQGFHTGEKQVVHQPNPQPCRKLEKGGIVRLSSDCPSLACAAAHMLGMRNCGRPVTPRCKCQSSSCQTR